MTGPRMLRGTGVARSAQRLTSTSDDARPNWSRARQRHGGADLTIELSVGESTSLVGHVDAQHGETIERRFEQGLLVHSSKVGWVTRYSFLAATSAEPTATASGAVPKLVDEVVEQVLAVLGQNSIAVGVAGGSQERGALLGEGLRPVG